MNLLAIDTSTERAFVALVIDGQYRSLEQAAQRQHTQLILPMINQLLAEAQTSLAQLQGLVFGCGPGSFTGLRIACSVAKGLAYAHDLPLYPVSSLAAIAWEVFEQQPMAETVLSIIDARMQQVYWACYDRRACEVEAQVSAMEAIEIDKDGPVLLAGVGYQNYRAQLPASINSKIMQDLEVYPQAKAMLKLVLAGKVRPVTVEEALPVYIRNQIIQGATRG